VNWANILTLSRIAGVPIFLIALRVEPWWVSFGLFVILAGTDLLDGYVARKQKKASRAGAVLDPLADKLLVCGALIFLMKQGLDAWIVYTIVAREFLITGLRTLTESVILASWWGKVKTFVQVVAIGWALLAWPYTYWFMIAAVVLSVASGLQYFWVARKELYEQLR